MILKTKSGREVIVDDDFNSGEIFSGNKYLTICGNRARVCEYLHKNPDGSSRVNMKMLHRVITNAPKGVQVDHINGNPLDNRKSNLRFVNNTQNSWDRGDKKGSTSKYRGVTRRKDGKFQAQIRIGNKRRLYLGVYGDELDAYIAYCEAQKEFHGEYRRRKERDAAG
jgi:bacteriophage protein